MTVPPPPPYSKPAVPWHWVLIVCAASVCFICGAFGLVVYRFGQTSATPPLRPGAGHPATVQMLGDGWRVVDLPEVPMRVSLPGPPRQEKLFFSKTSYLTVQNWTAYLAHEAKGWAGIVGTWYRHPERIDLEKSIKGMKSQIEKNPTYTDFNGQYRSYRIGTLDGWLLEGTYTNNGRAIALKQFLWRHGDATFFASVRHYGSPDDSILAELQRIVGSVEYR